MYCFSWFLSACNKIASCYRLVVFGIAIPRTSVTPLLQACSSLSASNSLFFCFGEDNRKSFFICSPLLPDSTKTYGFFIHYSLEKDSSFFRAFFIYFTAENVLKLKHYLYHCTGGHVPSTFAVRQTAYHNKSLMKQGFLK